MNLWSPIFGLKFLRDRLDQRKRSLDAAEEAGNVLPWSVYDYALQGLDSRVNDPSKRSTWWHRKWGSMSRMYCVSCGRQSPYAVSETMLFTVYQCNECTNKYGAPPKSRHVATSAW